ncbi:MAG: hypothetical protein H6633_26025 [Anaerolineales bacterium]|nr:hypothetical protein [Anaerolineales bacterium]
MAKLEQVFEFIKTLATEGLAAAWQQLLSYIGSLKDMVIGAIREWVVTKIVTSAITKLVSMFNPAGAVIQAIMAIYNTIKFFIERADQLAELANAVFGSIGSIAAGSIGAAAGYIEKTMGRAIPIMLGFLARLIGLGGVGGKIKNIIRGIQAKISKAIDRFISFIRQKARKLFRRGGKAKEEPNNVSEKDRQAGLAAFEKEEKKYIKDGGITREDAKKTAASVKKKYPVFKSVSVVDGKDSWDYQYVFRAKVDTPTEKAEINISEADIAKTVDEAIRARGTAIADLQKRRGQEKGKKTVACVGTKCFMSGWTEERPEAHLATMTVLFEEGKEKERMIRESGSSVKEHAEKFTDTKKKPKVEGLEYQTRGSGYLDKGVSGRYVASHAEKQAAQWAPNQPIGVTRGMCGDCQRYFKSLAKRTKRLQVVADPNVVRIFHTDGTVETR